MWSRWTEKARAAVWAANEEAIQRGQQEVKPEHLVLGLLRDEESVARRFLAELNVAPDALRASVLESLPEIASAAHPTAEPPRYSTVKPVLDATYQEARELNCNYVGTEHLLLGLLRQPNSASAVLESAGLEWELLREAVQRSYAQRAPGGPPLQK